MVVISHPELFSEHLVASKTAVLYRQS